MHTQKLELAITEIIAGFVVALTALVMLTAYLVDALGFPLEPRGIGFLMILEALILAGALWRRRNGLRVRAGYAETLGWCVVVLGFGAYLLWLAWSSWLPRHHSADLVHHLGLINFIEQQRSLAHDPRLAVYLEDVATYPPGSHVLAVMLAGWFGATSIYVIHPLLAALVALKAGYVFHIILRLLPSERRSALLAGAGTLFLLMAYEYFLDSFTVWGFFAQVVSETFAVAMLWVIVVMREARPSLGLMLFFTVCGGGVYLSWPVWLPVAFATLGCVLGLRRDWTWRTRSVQGLWAFVPAAVLAGVYTLNSPLAGALVTSGGYVVKPWVSLYGELFLVLFVLGLLTQWRRAVVAPVGLFLGVGIAQTLALLVIAVYQSEWSLYRPFKMFHLHLYPMVIYAALAADELGHLFTQLTPMTWRRIWGPARALWPPLLLALVVWHGLPTSRSSAFTEPVYQAGLWAKVNLPVNCVDYLVDDRIAAYGLHLAVLGNPRVLERAERVLDERRYVEPTRWSNPDRLPFAIVEDLRSVPPAARADFKILHSVGDAAVVQRLDPAECRADVTPLDRFVVTPRGWTLAGALGLR